VARVLRRAHRPYLGRRERALAFTGL
jgi:hypothetical protein